MFKIALFIFSFILSSLAYTQNLHVFVALCDNENQGIVPVPSKLGNGKDPAHNLYWGAAYGVKSYFQYKTKDWEWVKTIKSENPKILQRILFKHTHKEAYLLADAYDGAFIQTCTKNFLLSANGQSPEQISYEGKDLTFGGGADLLAYIGHDGLMEFEVDLTYQPIDQPKDLIILACSSQTYFGSEVEQANAHPLLWTTNLMAPEAYSLHAAIAGWLEQENGELILERAAQAYNTYQKCGIGGARSLFATGF
ncbi:MAG: hypothetical protein AAF694_09030 [Bacteroidota bacterium]